MKDPKFPFMAKVKDKVTGLTGTVTAFCVYMNGCRQYDVKYLNKEKDDIKGWWFDEDRLELIVAPSESKAPKNNSNPGGPSRRSSGS